MAVDWNEVGALASCAAVVLAVLGGLAKWIVGEIRKNRSGIDAVNRRVTTPSSVTGTLGETVAHMSNQYDEHERTDDDRFEKLWKELGKVEP